MRRVCKLLISAVLCACILSGCGKEVNSEFVVDSESEANPFEKESGQKKHTEVMGSISHGIEFDGDSENTGLLQYNGGEIEIPYSVNASGVASSCGFYIYLDGIPQPYKLKGVNEEYSYMHTLELNEGQDEYYTFAFMPVTGKKDEELSICIVSVTNPDFKPDMSETFSYGHYHKALESIYTIKFAKDTDASENDFINAEGVRIGNNLSISSDKVSSDELSAYSKNGIEFLPDKDVITEFYIDDENMELLESYNFKDKKTLHVKYRIIGHPGIQYKTTFYADNKPILADGEIAFTSNLKNGEAQVTEFELDVSDIESASFYAISVPCNKEDYPEDAITIIKTNSVLLYSE